MITKTLNLASTYQDLFAEILARSTAANQADPEQPVINVDSLEHFFENLSKIKNLDIKYLRLPLDEPLLKIDANSRKIDVPAEFKANGLSVQGDHLAETVFFSIDRYFDYKDLSLCDISIKWKIGSKVGKTKNFIADKDVMPGYIVFGWPIDKEITEKGGTLTFAVEFNQVEGEVVKYSFNTLISGGNIKDGLVVEDVKAVSLDDDILTMLSDSTYGSGEAAVGEIRWLTGNGNGLVVGVTQNGRVVLQEFQGVISLPTYLDPETGDPQSGTAVLYAEAFVDKTSDVKYMNNHGEDINPDYLPISRLVEFNGEREEGVDYYNAAGEIVPPPSNEEPQEGDEEPTVVLLYTLEPLDENLKYYVKNDTTPVSYSLAEDADLEDVTKVLYLKVGKIEVNEAGTYSMKAQGFKVSSVQPELVIGTGKTSTTSAVVIPDVEKPEAVDIVCEGFIPAEGSNYSYEAEENNVVFLGQDGATLTASARVQNFGAASFTWKSKIGNAADMSAVDGADTSFKLENSSILPIDEPGKYQVSVVHFLNKTSSTAVDSAVITAYEPAGAVTDAIVLYKGLVNGAPMNDYVDIPEAGAMVSFNPRQNVNGAALLKIALPEGAVADPSEKVELAWGLKYDDEIRIMLSLVLSNGVTALVYKPTIEGTYVPLVRNKYHGSIYTKQFNSIFVNESN